MQPNLRKLAWLALVALVPAAIGCVSIDGEDESTGEGDANVNVDDGNNDVAADDDFRIDCTGDVDENTNGDDDSGYLACDLDDQ